MMRVMCRRWSANCLPAVVYHDGAAELEPGITLHLVGGHTRGLQVVRVHTLRGWVVLASDAAHFYANWLERRPFPIVDNVAAYLDALATIESLASSPQHVIPGHDPEVLVRYPKARAGLANAVRVDSIPAVEKLRGLKQGTLVGEKIAFIGVGRMGSAMVARLIAAGHELTIYDPVASTMAVAAALGARVASSASDAAASSTVAMASVPGPADAREVARLISDSPTVKIFLDPSTSGPAAARAIAALLAGRGIAAVDALVSGEGDALAGDRWPRPCAGHAAGELAARGAGQGQAGRKAGPRPDRQARQQSDVGSVARHRAEALAMG